MAPSTQPQTVNIGFDFKLASGESSFIFLPERIIAKCTLFFVLRFATSQAGITARTLTLMQGSEENE